MERPESTRWFWWALGAVVIGGLTIRLVYVFVSRQHYDFGGDAYFYHAGANVLADGKGFTSPFYPHRVVQAAEHPPLYVMFLAIPSALGFQSVLAHLVWSSILGAGTIVLVGLIGRQVVGPRVGVVAAVLAAVYPNVWVPDTSLMAETLAMSATALDDLPGVPVLEIAVDLGARGRGRGGRGRRVEPLRAHPAGSVPGDPARAARARTGSATPVDRSRRRWARRRRGGDTVGRIQLQPVREARVPHLVLRLVALRGRLRPGVALAPQELLLATVHDRHP